MHTISCATAHTATCSCACNHTLHGYLSGVLSHEQTRRVQQPLLAAAETYQGWDPNLHADHALHELDRLLGQASQHLEAGVLGSDTLNSLLATVLDAAVEQQANDDALVAQAAASAEAAMTAAEVEAVQLAAAELKTADALLAASMAEDRAEAAELDEMDARLVASLATDRAAAAEASSLAQAEATEATLADAATQIAEAKAEAYEAEERAELVSADAADAVGVALQAELAAEHRTEVAEAERDAAFLRAAAAESRAIAAEERLEDVETAARAAMNVADAEVASAQAEAARAEELEERAEATTSWVLGRLHVMCGLCVAAVAQLESDEETLAVAEFLEATLGSSSATPLSDAELADVRDTVAQVLGADAVESLLNLASLPSKQDLSVLAIAFCPAPSEHPEVERLQRELTDTVVGSLLGA